VDPIERLIEALKVLPGVGQKSAQRMAFHLLARRRQAGLDLAEALTRAMEGIGPCRRCRNWCEGELCRYCSGSRDDTQLTVVEGVQDLNAIEQATGYRGRYFVLHGRLSPMDGIGPNDLGLSLLAERLDEGLVTELIIATNPTVEGETTAHFLARMASDRGIRATRIAHGVPVGGELEYIDRTTLARAFGGRVGA
jgi:recombination protein RecR